jgi:transcriptional regulator GlxA family with amidase domain
VETFAFLLMPGFSAMAFFSAVEPLRVANRLSGVELYRWSMHAPAPDHAPGGRFADYATASNGIEIRTDGPLPENAATVLVCAGFDPLAHAGRALLGSLRRAWRMGASLGAIDTGAFLLAEAGILDGETITLHWEAAAAFCHDYPRIAVSGELYERHARLFTCAGGTAAMDMMLAAIGVAHGNVLANAVSEQLIHDRIRPAGDPQRIDIAARVGTGGPLVVRATAMMERTIAAPLPIAAIAAQLGVTRKTLERQFAEDLGTSPARHYRTLRVKRALEMAAAGTIPLHAAAAATGFSSQSVLSRACLRVTGLSPRAVRNALPRRVS